MIAGNTTTGSLSKNERQYFYYTVDHEALGSKDILSFRIKGGDMFTDPDVYLTTSSQT